MQDIANIFQNKILIVSLIACFLAQAIKIIIDVIIHRKFNFKIFVSTGGMPSSHSALVGALATAIGQIKGWASSEFAIAALFAVIVMYDAAGIRQAAGKQAKILNQIMDEFITSEDFNEEKLKELLGHTPFQVFVGLALGITVSFFMLPI